MSFDHYVFTSRRAKNTVPTVIKFKKRRKLRVYRMGVTEQLIMFVLEQFTFTTAVLFFTFLFVIYITKYFLYLRSLPPGPTGIPIFGSLLSFKKPFHLQMYDFAQQYGKLMSVRMGSQLVVVINDVNLLKKAFSQHEFTARPKSVLDSICQGYGKLNFNSFCQIEYFDGFVLTFTNLNFILGLITSDGALWKSQRSFIHKHKFGLKFWGNIGDQMEQRVSHEVLCCLTAIHNGSKYSEDVGTKNLGIDPSAYLSCSISNVICSIIMSTRFKHGEERFKQFIQFFDEGFRLFKLTGVMMFLPFIKMFPAMSEVCNKLKKNREELLNFVAEIIEEHKRSLDSKSPRDLVDSYLLEIEKTRENGTTEEVFQSKEPEVQLQQVLVDLFSAGFETVKTTLLWTIIHMLRNPEIKRKVQEELERVVGGNRLPCLDDMSRLNYSRACIYESMRRSLAVPLGTTHSNTR